MKSLRLSLLLAAFCIPLITCMAIKRIPFNGLLLDAQGKAIRNARIWTDDKRDYALSDKQGRFRLTDVAPTDTIFIEIKKTKYSLPVDGKKSIRILLGDEIVSSEDTELASYGYGYVSRRERTSPSDYISGTDLLTTGRSDVITALQGKVAGLDITYENGEQVIRMRGNKSILGDSTPLYIVDGLTRDTLSDVPLNDIDYVEVMKDGSIYGSRGANGAIYVHTKYEK